jgi:hypothetical protein
LDLPLDADGDRERDMVDDALDSIPLLSDASAPSESLGFLGLFGGSPCSHRRSGVPGRDIDTDLSDDTDDLLARVDLSPMLLCRAGLAIFFAGSDWLLDSSCGIRVGSLLACLLAGDRADFLDRVEAAVDEATEFWRDILVGVFAREREGAGDWDVRLSDESECERGRGFLVTSEVEGEGETLDDRLLGL